MSADFEIIMRQVEAQLAEYEREIAEYAAFMADWRIRNRLAAQAAE